MALLRVGARVVESGLDGEDLAAGTWQRLKARPDPRSPQGADHGGHLLDHLEVGVKHNETSHFTQLLEPLDLVGAVVTTDTLHAVRTNLN